MFNKFFVIGEWDKVYDKDGEYISIDEVDPLIDALQCARYLLENPGCNDDVKKEYLRHVNNTLEKIGK